MIEKLQGIEAIYLALREQMMDPEIVCDLTKTRDIARQMRQREEAYNLYQTYKQAQAQKVEALAILAIESDSDFISMAKEQLSGANDVLEQLDHDLKIALLPKDPNDEKDIFLEVRPAAGGDEAGLFAAELLKCYMLYASRQGWTTEMIDNQLTDVGGVKNCTIKIAGESVYSKLKRESGVHRVQRIPSTESQGRVHTSTITVAIMPEVEEIDAVIDMADIEMDTYAASSSGGQNANKNQTGVRLRHKPTGIIVNIGDTKSQLKNKERAFSILRSRLYQLEIEKIQADQKDVRSAQIGTGDRSEKIRTYNYPQDRITDHRLKESRSNLPVVMQGNIDDIIVACTMYFQAQFLSESVS